MEKTQYVGDNPVPYVEPGVADVKIMSATGMAALIEEHADYWGGADRLARLLDACTDAHTWNRLGNMLSLDLCDGAN